LISLPPTKWPISRMMTLLEFRARRPLGLWHSAAATAGKGGRDELRDCGQCAR
jgi:hypothetical protein